MRVIGRVLMVILAYLLACGAASIVLTVGLLRPQRDAWLLLGMHSTVVWALVLVSAVAIAGIAMLPALLVIALAEGFAWRSSLLYAALGGVLALSLSYGLDFAGYPGGPGGDFVPYREVLAASGIAGGFVYWFFAGRSAGAGK
jgi:hypothetical protein